MQDNIIRDYWTNNKQGKPAARNSYEVRWLKAQAKTQRGLYRKQYLSNTEIA